MRRGPARRTWILLAVAAVGAALVTGGILASVHPGAPQATARDMAGHRVALDPGVVPDQKTVAAMHIDAATGLRLVVPSAPLDVPVAAMNEVDGSITPPGFQDAYWVRHLGADPAKPDAGTVFVVMHSIRGGGVGPGNYLIDIDHGTSRLSVGATIRLAGSTYAVTGSRTVDKKVLPTESDVWENLPGRLVIITCLQTPDGHPSTKNLVITATLQK